MTFIGKFRVCFVNVNAVVNGFLSKISVIFVFLRQNYNNEVQ